MIGRPPLPPDEKNRRFSISVPAALAAVLAALENRSAWIASAIAEKLKRDERKTRASD